jgi:ferredoxin
MTHVVTSKCADCKDLGCIRVCPVDCIYIWEGMVVIDPDKCIDCAICVLVCPVNAIISDEDATEDDILINSKAAKSVLNGTAS